MPPTTNNNGSYQQQYDSNGGSGGGGGVAATYPNIVMEGEATVSERQQAAATTTSSSSNITNEYVLNVAFYTFVGFLLLEAVFAIIAGSQSMLEDAEAMSVDALTYLFNLWAERVKHRPYSEKELSLPIPIRDYRRELSRLYVELIPPFISVSTLIVVTVLATRDAFDDLFYGRYNNNTAGGGDDDAQPEEADVNVNIMLYFSAGNLLLDVINVTCFARANQTFGLSIQPQKSTALSMRSGEMQHLLPHSTIVVVEDGGGGGGDESTTTFQKDTTLSLRPEPIDDDSFVNLNMCSAWTHVCADTLRSVSVLIAAAIASIFSETVSGALADSLAVIVVSAIIMISLIPLLNGLYLTASKIVAMRGKEPVIPMSEN